MNRVVIGVHVYAEPDRLKATLDAVSSTAPDVPILLLPDGPDEPTRATLDALAHLKKSATAEPQGAAACFNRLASAGNEDIIVLLESGAQPAPRWLDHLLAALDADPSNGLAGPTTNLSWNEQALPSTIELTVADAAREAERRFCGANRTLEPLYSLADFCYVVRREVIERVGGADERYGLGPCWEMDYNIRAARAGFRGVWASTAYVHRSPFTTRRRIQELQRFEASRHLYQDKFCGRRLRGSHGSYRLHCSGDVCPNFAPSDLVAIYRPLDGGIAAVPAPSPSCGACSSQDTTSEQIQNRPAIAVADEAPLVTCIMPTADRPAFVPQAIRAFQRQDYPRSELLIVDDGAGSIEGCVPSSDRIRYLRVTDRRTIGAKRNLACAEARGELILHWDDDDWYPPSRIRRQMTALLERRVDLCGTSTLMFYDASADRAWEYRYEPNGVKWVCGTSLLYRKAFWQRHKFSDIQVGEDAQFIWSGMGASLFDMRDSTLCVAMVHKGNTSPKDTAATFWHSRPASQVHELLGDDVWLYRTASPADRTGMPLVSCIMPTYNRRRLVPLAVRLFHQQDYPSRELIVIDDGDDPVEDLVGRAEGVRYFRLPGRKSIGAKRNFGCEQARGDIIAHWDDDDWYAPDRLRYQVGPIVAGVADITGLDSGPVLDVTTASFWTTRHDLHRRMFAGNVHGGTLVFRRQLLTSGIRYPDVSLAEDAWLLQMLQLKGSRLRRLSNPGVFVYVRHDRNAWREYAPGTFIDPKGWERVAPPASFPDDALASLQAAVTTI